ncbi:hypothetical protein EYC80_003895 [Monilinia laxa]|uniref:Uncharacterized protein n=1 Tax=Monilinia laxa TaxID=61186 RepID=A0A5N6KLE4_MONLA|nr:hypothetical protein EYC80_003895 [Monilinia laxa]
MDARKEEFLLWADGSELLFCNGVFLVLFSKPEGLFPLLGKVGNDLINQLTSDYVGIKTCDDELIERLIGRLMGTND